MDNMKILTICTAAYNAEKFIEKMIESILACKNRNLIELIIVNDGSTDGTQEIVNKYAKEYPEIVKSIIKENGGSGSARNRAFLVATGKYIKLVDADDYVVTEQLENYIQILEEIDVDVIFNGYYRKNISSHKKKRVDFFGNWSSEKIYDLRIKPPKVYNLDMHMVTFRTRILQKNHIQLSEHMAYVDLEYLFLPMIYVNTAIYIKNAFYVYQKGISGQSVDKNVVLRKGPQIRVIVNRIMKEYDKHNKNIADGTDEILKMVITKACAGSYVYLLVQNDYALKKELIELDTFYKTKNLDVWKRIPYISKSVRIMRLCGYRGLYIMIILRKIFQI